MSKLIAALPMYDRPECRQASDASWARLREALRATGIDAPQALTRRDDETPPVDDDIGGRGPAPEPVAPSRGEFDLYALWRHPRLLFAQTCWGPMERGLAAHVHVVGQPDYSAYEGGAGELYSSAIVMRAESTPTPNPSPQGGGELCGRAAETSPSLLWGGVRGGGKEQRESGVEAPRDGRAVLPLDLLRGRRLAYNGPDSMSGFLALARDLEAMGESLDLFAQTIETGSHRASARAVAEGNADVCALDCRSWHLIRRYDAFAADLAVVGWTARRKGLPFICSKALPGDVVQAVRDAVARAAL